MIEHERDHYRAARDTRPIYYWESDCGWITQTGSFHAEDDKAALKRVIEGATLLYTFADNGERRILIGD